MMKNSAIRLYVYAGLALALVLTAAPARAQYRPRPVSTPPTGESYHIEFGVGLWTPSADITLSSESLGIPGSTIDFKNDLGLTNQKFPEFQVVLRPTKKNKLRAQYIPIKFDQTATLSRDIVFNGQRYVRGLPVTSTLQWKALRFDYEYDFISRDRGFAGVLLDVKYTDVQATLASGSLLEFTHAKAPIPAIGGIVRYYVVSNLSLTGELTGFSVGWLPDSITKGNTGHYADLDLYATLNLTNNFGVQAGYRSFDVGYFVKTDSGTFTLKGLYFGAVARY